MSSKLKDLYALKLINLKHIDSKNEEEVMEMLKKFPDLYSLISTSLTPRLNNLVVEYNPRFVLSIDNPPIGLWYTALQKDPTIMKEIENPTMRECVNAVSANWISVNFIPDEYKTLRIRKLAYDQSGNALSLLIDKAQLPEILHVAKHDGEAFENISEAKLYQRVKDIIIKKSNVSNPQFLIEFIHAQMIKIYHEACIKHDSNDTVMSISKVPMKYLTDDVIRGIITENNNQIFSLPDTLMKKDYIKIAVKTEPDAGRLLSEQDATIETIFELYNINNEALSLTHLIGKFPPFINTPTNSVIEFVRKYVCRYNNVYHNDNQCYSINYIIDHKFLPRSVLLRLSLYREIDTYDIIHIIDYQPEDNDALIDVDDATFYDALVDSDCKCYSHIKNYYIKIISDRALQHLRRRHLITHGCDNSSYIDMEKLSFAEIKIAIQSGSCLSKFSFQYKSKFHYLYMKIISHKMKREKIPYIEGH